MVAGREGGAATATVLWPGDDRVNFEFRVDSQSLVPGPRPLLFTRLWALPAFASLETIPRSLLILHCRSCQNPRDAELPRVCSSFSKNETGIRLSQSSHSGGSTVVNRQIVKNLHIRDSYFMCYRILALLVSLVVANLHCWHSLRAYPSLKAAASCRCVSGNSIPWYVFFPHMYKPWAEFVLSLRSQPCCPLLFARVAFLHLRLANPELSFVSAISLYQFYDE